MQGLDVTYETGAQGFWGRPKAFKALEDEMGAPLFLRTPAGVELTEAGQTLLDEVPNLLHLAQRAAEDAAPGQALWYKRPGERYWDQRYARDHDGVSVAEQSGKPASLLNHYRKLTALRKAHPALMSGAQRVLESPEGVLMVERKADRCRLARF